MFETINIAHVVSFTLAFIITLGLGPIFIPILRRLKFGQTIRDDGPKSHLSKMGTPTMGGITFIITTLLVGGIYSIFNPDIIPLLLVLLGFSVVGFIDDFIKIVKKRKDGLYPAQKMLGLLIVAIAFSVYLWKAGLGTEIYIPFVGGYFDLAWAFIPFTVLVLIASSNSVNMTDGLDGLAAGVTLIVLVFFAIISRGRPEWESIRVFSAILAGGCLGFLAFNLYPAKMFMGDTGSLALGSAVGAIAIIMKLPLLLFLVGAIYVVESMSVILQVASYKLRKKRIFKMAPIHHHFELLGWKETKVVSIFWAITVLFCVVAFLAIRTNIYP
jgi:phospho-N-acetylmuramoyl-pentapeptide-transferase